MRQRSTPWNTGTFLVLKRDFLCDGLPNKNGIDSIIIQHVAWPAEVVKILVLKVGGEYFAVGKDARGKVRKPSSHKSVDLSVLVANS